MSAGLVFGSNNRARMDEGGPLQVHDAAARPFELDLRMLVDGVDDVAVSRPCTGHEAEPRRLAQYADVALHDRIDSRFRSGGAGGEHEKQEGHDGPRRFDHVKGEGESSAPY